MNRNLLGDNRFWPHFWTQFFGAFNDNAFKSALIILITFKAISIGGFTTAQLVALCGGIFILPFFLFSSIAGQLADKLSKSRMICWIKIFETLIMILGAWGFVTKNPPVLLAALFLLGLQSTFFIPVKYSILPDLLRENELVAGNAYVGTGTFIAILAGTVVGGALIPVPGYGPWLVSAVFIATALLGWALSQKIKYIQPAAPDLKFRANPIGPTVEILRLMIKDRSVFLSVLGISWFWFIGSAFLALLPPFCKDSLQAQESVVTFFLALFSTGIGVGSILCDRISFHRLEIGLVPLGSAGMSLFAFDLFLASRPALLLIQGDAALSAMDLLSAAWGWRIVLDLLFFSVSSGLFIVPLYTLVQQRSPGGERSRVIAANNILNSLFMVVSALFLLGLFSLQLSVRQIYLALSIINILVAVYIYTVIPEFLFRLLCWFLANILYRIKISGRENIPLEGPAILVCNHVSFVDWLIIAGACHRPTRFVMHYSFLSVPFAGRIFKDAKIIPISGAAENFHILKTSLDQIEKELKDGQIVCIFPEGKITEDGEIGPFKPGIERIVRKTPAVVVPMAIEGLWGSFFSKKYGKPMSRPFRRFWSRISLNIGKPVPPGEVSAEKLRAAVCQLKDEC
ncbi:MAG: MFS transporter [Desulfobacterales bacterium]|nr:MFS transporter [Desulfobacterales bacterium]